MRIVIIGAGNAGRNLAARLSEERHDIVMVDRDAEKLEQVQAQLDVQTVEGDASDPLVLRQAEISKAGLLVAVTSRDAVNILVCAFAHLVGVPMKVARVSSCRAYSDNSEYDLHKLGIDLVVSRGNLQDSPDARHHRGGRHAGRPRPRRRHSRAHG